MNAAEFLSAIDDLRMSVLKPVEHELMEAHALPSVLYHYTAAHNLEPILNSGCLRMTEGRYLNDATELRHGGHRISDYLSGDWPQVPRVVQPKGIFIDYGWLLKPIVQALDAHLKDVEHRMFVLSFTKLANSLSQWVRYAGDGNGVALGFDLSRLRAPEALPPGPGLSEPVVGPCTYDLELQGRAIERVVKPMIEFAIEQEQGFGPEPRVELIRATAVHVLLTSALLGGVLKHPGFVEEEEWRVLVLSASKAVPAAVKTRPHRYGTGDAEYIELQFGTTAGLPITHVTLGPRVDPSTEQRVRDCLANYGHTPQVVRSGIPYLG